MIENIARTGRSKPDDLIGLAITILRRKAAKHWRHLRRQKRLSGAGGDDTGDLAEVLTSINCPGTDPAAAAPSRDQVDALDAHLDDTEKRILSLRVDGHTPAEIAEQLGVSWVAIRVRTTRLRQRLEDSGVVADWL